MKSNQNDPIIKFKDFEKFGVKFGDNDFFNTFSRLLPAICEGIIENNHFFKEHWKDSPNGITKEYLAEVINNTSTGFYYAYQNPLLYNIKHETNGKGKWENPKKYLQITPDQIYINEEVDNYIEETYGWDNSEFFYVEIYATKRGQLVPKFKCI